MISFRNNIFIKTLFLLIPMTYCCQGLKKPELNSGLDKSYIRYYNWKNSIDTVKIDWDTTILTTIDTFNFKYKDKTVKLEKKILDYKKAKNVPMDGGFIVIYEKDLGVIYSRPLCYTNNSNNYSSAFETLRTNNDSINDYITYILGKMLTYPYFCKDTIPLNINGIK